MSTISKASVLLVDDSTLFQWQLKKHLNNIYGKLGVKNRTQAVAKARELNLMA